MTGSPRIEVTHFSDPGCPWAYSASPALAVLRWRYGTQLDWRLVTIGLTESGRVYEERGYTPARAALGYRRFRRFGMPFAVAPRARMLGTGRACRVLVAVRLSDPALEWPAFRALQFAWFNTTLLLDEPDGIAEALGRVDGLDIAAVIEASRHDEVEAVYQADRVEARTAAGSPTEFQGKSAASDGPVRYTAPSLIFTGGGRTLEGGGFQPVEAYDVLLANLDPELSREAPPKDVGDLLDRFPEGLTTQEVAAVLTEGNDAPDRAAAEVTLIELAARNEVERLALGDDALWRSRRSS
jgi:2-hydroxychromene-2-carboxylate isomerase